MRSNYSVKNSISSLICNVIILVTNFIFKTVFIKTLGIEYFGLNGLFENIFTLFNFFELGIGSAIVFNLYKPISENDISKIKSLVFFYKHAYRVISLVILFLGFILLFFIRKIVQNITINVDIYVVYFLFLLSTLLTYSAAYKKSFIIANQRMFVINIIHVIYVVVMNFFQLFFLFIFKNFYIYLIIKIFFQFLENIAICLKANRDYPFLVNTSYDKLDIKTQKDIFSRVRALINHKFGSIIIYGTDNILVSFFFGIATVGLYTNYMFIFNAVTVIFSGIISSLSASIGNLLVESNKSKNIHVFQKINFLNYWIAVFTSICLLFLTQPFIELWLGKDFLLDFSVLFIIVLNYYQSMMRNSYSTFKDSAGVWIDDKWIPIFEAFINIVCSIILIRFLGLKGVFLGTIISSSVLWFYSYPKFVYKKIFDGRYSNYIKTLLSHLFLFIIIIVFTYFLLNLFLFNSLIIKFIYNCFVCLVVPNVFIYIIYHKSPSFSFIYDIIKKH